MANGRQLVLSALCRSTARAVICKKNCLTRFEDAAPVVSGLSMIGGSKMIAGVPVEAVLGCAQQTRRIKLQISNIPTAHQVMDKNN